MTLSSGGAGSPLCASGLVRGTAQLHSLLCFNPFKNISRIVLHPKLLQQGEVFLSERLPSVMLLLLINILYEPIEMRVGVRKRTKALLPVELPTRISIGSYNILI